MWRGDDAIATIVPGDKRVISRTLELQRKRVRP